MKILLLLLAGLLAPADPPAELVPLEAAPIEGQSVTLIFRAGDAPAADLGVKAIYRENATASIRRELDLGKTDSAGQLQWTPDAAGVVVLTWGETEEKETLSVAYASTPAGAVIVAVFAGLLLLGGSALFFVLMMRDGGTSFDPEDQIPST